MQKGLTFAILMFAVPAYAQDQQPNTAKLKADAEKVVRIISGDKAKSQIYCQIADLGNEIDQEKDSKKAQALFGKMNELQKQLGPANTSPSSPIARTWIQTLKTVRTSFRPSMNSMRPARTEG